VAGAARDHPGILIVGLIFAVALMGLAANSIARYIERYRWIAMSAWRSSSMSR
jgi:predicted tellurium resistance membrane protein TerC